MRLCTAMGEEKRRRPVVPSHAPPPQTVSTSGAKDVAAHFRLTARCASNAAGSSCYPLGLHEVCSTRLFFASFAARNRRLRRRRNIRRCGCAGGRRRRGWQRFGSRRRGHVRWPLPNLRRAIASCSPSRRRSREGRGNGLPDLRYRRRLFDGVARHRLLARVQRERGARRQRANPRGRGARQRDRLPGLCGNGLHGIGPSLRGARSVDLSSRSVLGRAALRSRLGPVEQSYAGLMRCAAGSGRRADGLRLFEQCRARLLGDFGEEPGPELTRLRARLS